MEKYWVTEITKTSDSDAYAKLVTEKNSLSEAKSLFYQVLSSIYANPNIEYALVYAKDYYGNDVLMDKIIPEPVYEESEF